MIKACVLTGNRADYGPLYPLLKTLQEDRDFELNLVVTGSHLSNEFGGTLSQILEDGFQPSATIDIRLKGDSEFEAARSVGVGVLGLSEKIGELAPELLIVLGDRYELLAALAVCVCMRIPVVHIGGGHVTRGAMDEQIRHALTKIAHLHCVPTRLHARRVAQMGEEAWRICVSGSLGLDNIAKLDLPSFKDVAARVGIDPHLPTALVTFHPLTLQAESMTWHVENMLSALETAGLQYVFTYPNADPRNYEIRQKIEFFARTYRGRAVVVKNLGQRQYLCLMKNAAVVVGNSSSAIIEAPSFNVPVVNIGDRQAGRLFAPNIFQAGHERQSILTAIDSALIYERCAFINPYGDGQASERIVSFIKQTFASKTKRDILEKYFVDIEGT